MTLPSLVINVIKYKAQGLALTFIRAKPERTCLAKDVPPKNNLFFLTEERGFSFRQKKSALWVLQREN